MVESNAHEHDVDTLHREHIVWLTSSGKQGKRAIFRMGELCDRDLSGFQLAQASLRGVVIRNVNFAGADLTGCDLSEAVLEQVDFAGARLAHSQMMRTRMHKVRFDEADLAEADLLGVIARDVTFLHSRMERVSLRDVNLQNANLTKAQLFSASLRGTMCLNVNFDQADLREADCRGAIFDRASFSQADMTGTYFKDATLHAINLHGTDFSGAIELAFDPQVQELVDERLRLQAKQRAIAEQNGLLNKDRRKLAAQEAELALRESRFERALRDLKTTAMAYGALCIGWLVMSGFLLSFTVTRVVELGLGRVFGVVAGVVFVLILSFLSFYFAVKTRSALLEVINREQPKS